MLAIIAVIQVLPQVDLPDTAFHEDTAPVVTKFRILTVPVASTTPSVVSSGLRFAGFNAWSESNQESTIEVSAYGPVLLFSLRC